MGRFLRAIAYASLGALLGTLLGFVVGRIVTAGYLARWHKLPAPPEAVTELVVSAYGNIYARTSNNVIYRCSSWKNECWVRDEIPQEITESTDTEITRPCDFSSPEFFVLANSPGDTADCIQDETTYSDGFIKHTCVLDKNGYVWEWSNSFGVRGGLYILQLLAIIGAIIGLIAASSRRRTLALLAKYHNALPN